MRKIFLVLMLGVVAWSGRVEAQVARDTIAFVNYEEVFTNYFKTKLANEQLQVMLDSINRERAILVLQFDQLQGELNSMRSRVMTEELDEAAKKTLRQGVDAKLVELRKQEERTAAFNESQEKRWEEQNRRIRESLMRDIRQKMEGLMKARGFYAVVDSSLVSGKGVPSVLCLDPRVDITAEVIEEINK